MRHFIYTLLLFILTNNTTTAQTKLNTWNYYILNEEYLYKNNNAFTLSKQELETINLKLNHTIEKYNQNIEIANYEIINLNEYNRQYLPYINNKGEKIVWINCLCGKWSDKELKQLIMVEDGGTCFFNLSINLTTGEISKLDINGDA